MNRLTRPRLRTKTGCLTCRSRRKKCDETAPTCKNCIFSHRECRWPSTADSLDRRFASHAESRHRDTTTSSSPPIPLPEFDDDQLSISSQSFAVDAPSPSCGNVESISPNLIHYSLNPLAEANAAQKVLSPEIELKVARHFVHQYFTLLILPSSHPGFLHGWLTDIQQLMMNHKSLYYSVLACGASHIFLIDTSTRRMQDLTLTYYCNAITELSKLFARVPARANHDALLMSVMMLYMIALTSWDVDRDVPRHLIAATQIVTVRVLDQPSGMSQLFDRLAVESVMYRIFLLMTGLWSDSMGPDYEYDRLFWDRAEKLLERNTFFPGTSKGFNSPVLGVPACLFRITMLLRQYFHNGIVLNPLELESLRDEVRTWEAVLLDEAKNGYGTDDEISSISLQERYTRDLSYLYALSASLMLQQILHADTTIGIPRIVSKDSWQTDLGIRILKRNVDDDGWAKCYIGNWPIYTLGLFVESPKDRQIVRKQLQHSWNVTRFAQVARFKIDLENIRHQVSTV